MKPVVTKGRVNMRIENSITLENRRKGDRMEHDGKENESPTCSAFVPYYENPPIVQDRETFNIRPSEDSNNTKRDANSS